MDGTSHEQAISVSPWAVPVIAALCGALAAWALGRLTKLIEFRFAVIQIAIEQHGRLERAYWDLWFALSREEDAPPGDEASRTLLHKATKEARLNLGRLCSEVGARSTLIRVAFR